MRPVAGVGSEVKGKHAMKVIITLLLLMVMLPVFALASQVGTAAPDCSIPDLSGNIVTLQQMKGKVVLLDFWAPWCDQCKEEIPDLDALYRKYPSDKVAMIGVDIDSSEELLSEFLRKTPVSFKVLIDGKGVMRRAYRFRALPTTFIIGKDGIIRYMHMGYGKEFLPMYEKEIDELLKQP
jgi:peroxiredoxin